MKINNIKNSLVCNFLKYYKLMDKDYSNNASHQVAQVNLNKDTISKRNNKKNDYNNIKSKNMNRLNKDVTANISNKEIIKLNFLIDMHCHLHLYNEETDNKLDKKDNVIINNQVIHTIKSCQDNNINFLMTNSTHYDDFEYTDYIVKAIKKINNDDNTNKENIKNDNLIIIPSYGYHPWYLKQIYSEYLSKISNNNKEKEVVDNSEENWFIEYKNFIFNKLENKVKFGIGEIGIDGLFPIKDVPLSFQSNAFLKQFQLAEEHNLFVSIHCVIEWDLLYSIIKEFYSKNKSNNLIKNKKILLHSFQGTTEQMNKFVKEFNAWISISPGCYKKKNFEMLKKIELSNLVLESDSPSMFNKDIYKGKDDIELLNQEYIRIINKSDVDNANIITSEYVKDKCCSQDDDENWKTENKNDYFENTSIIDSCEPVSKTKLNNKSFKNSPVCMITLLQRIIEIRNEKKEEVIEQLQFNYSLIKKSILD